MIEDRVTTVIAAGAATNQWWLWTIDDVSKGASLTLTLLGILWLVVQLYFKIRHGK